MKDMLIVVTYLVVIFVIAAGWHWWVNRKPLARPYGRYQGRWSTRQFTPGPGGMFPIPFDEELQESRDRHPPLHGAQRANGERYCVRCGAWFRDQAFAIMEKLSLDNAALHPTEYTHRVCGFAAVHPHSLDNPIPEGDPEPESYDDKI